MKRLWNRLFPRKITLAQTSGCFEVHAFEPGKCYIVLYDPMRIDAEAISAIEFPDNIEVHGIPALFKHGTFTVKEIEGL